ncbi:unnamed protein product, partial [Iphiclides podalirius]
MMEVESRLSLRWRVVRSESLVKVSRMRVHAPLTSPPHPRGASPRARRLNFSGILAYTNDDGRRELNIVSRRRRMIQIPRDCRGHIKW